MTTLIEKGDDFNNNNSLEPNQNTENLTESNYHIILDTTYNDSKKIVIKKWSAVASWKYDHKDDVCAICTNELSFSLYI